MLHKAVARRKKQYNQKLYKEHSMKITPWSRWKLWVISDEINENTAFLKWVQRIDKKTHERNMTLKDNTATIRAQRMGEKKTEVMNLK